MHTKATTKKTALTVTALVKPELPFGERGKKLQTIGAYFAAHTGNELSVNEVTAACGTTRALVSLFITRHRGNFKQTPITMTSSRWTYKV